MVVENAGQGAHWAAPIASYIVEKYLRDSLTSRASGKTPQWIMDQNLLPALKTDVATAKRKAVADSVKSVKKDSIKQIKSAARGNKHNQQQLVAIQFRRKENE